jgi:predicted MPP superfamily phosphohydrolase
MTHSPLAWAAVAAAAIGQAALWVALDNRVSALGWPRWAVKSANGLLRVAMLLAGAASGWLVLSSPPGEAPSVAAWHVAAAAAIAVVIVPWRLVRPALARETTRLTRLGARRVDVRRQTGIDLAGSLADRFLLALPGNQCLAIDVEERQLNLPRLHPALDGLAIAHLSDLHFSGKIRRAYFEEAVRLVEGMDADLIAVTGDLVDRAECLDWVPGVLGRLRARLGVYYVLGNHDRRVNVGRLRRILAQSGLKALAGRWARVEWNGAAILLAGNERPWFAQASDPANAPTHHNDPRPLSILLAHTPDQLGWARRHGFDLMLAGHTHGGQIRLPLVGPIVAPSFYGVRHAAGTFYEPPTLMHVSRGLSGLDLLRFNCPPEITRLVLVGAEIGSRSSNEPARLAMGLP